MTRRFFRGLGLYQLVGVTNEIFELARGHYVRIGEGDKVVAPDIGGGGDAFDFAEVVESFRCDFQGDARITAFRKNNAGEDFAADLEAEIVGPGHILGGVGEGATEGADGIEVGHGA